MRLDNTPPAGAGRVQHVTQTEKLLKVIDGLGTDKYGNAIGIRSPELAAASGVPAKGITAMLTAAVIKGRVVVCKITDIHGRTVNEYRKGGGLPPPAFVPLNTKRAGIALRGTPKPVTTPTPLSTPKPTVGEIVTPTLISKTQPEVVAPHVAETPAAEGAAPPPAETAVTAQATPGPTPRAALKREPAAVKAPAGDVRIGINCDGVLVIAIDDDTIELNPKQARKLGHFMSGTAGVWNPF